MSVAVERGPCQVCSFRGVTLNALNVNLVHVGSGEKRFITEVRESDEACNDDSAGMVLPCQPPQRDVRNVFSHGASNRGLPQCYEKEEEREEGWRKSLGERQRERRRDKGDGGWVLTRIDITFLLTISVWKWKIPAVM